VIVVIAILAAITIVAFNGLQQRARNSARASELNSWVKVLKAYRSVNNAWPAGLTGGAATFYCLGEGFPVGAGGVPRCRDYLSTASGYLETDSATIHAQISTIASLPSGPKYIVNGTTVGIYANYLSGNDTIQLTQLFEGACPTPTVQVYALGNGYWCRLDVSP
jgi:type II secretory pathway pseudopilin PulG